MIAQPSPEAVELVHAAIRAERECVVEEEQNGFKTPRHWLLVGALDAASEALLQYVTTLEADRERLNWMDSHDGEVDVDLSDGATEIIAAYRFMIRWEQNGDVPSAAIRTIIDAARIPSEVSA